MQIGQEVAEIPASRTGRRGVLSPEVLDIMQAMKNVNGGYLPVTFDTGKEAALRGGRLKKLGYKTAVRGTTLYVGNP